MNYTNPGAVSHNEILQMYKDYIDPEFTWKNFTVEEQAKVIVAPRSNNLLDTKRVRCWPACVFGPALIRR
jgi:3,5-epimerase/4-reductase